MNYYHIDEPLKIGLLDFYENKVKKMFPAQAQHFIDELNKKVCFMPFLHSPAHVTHERTSFLPLLGPFRVSSRVPPDPML